MAHTLTPDEIEAVHKALNDTGSVRAAAAASGISYSRVRRYVESKEAPALQVRDALVTQPLRIYVWDLETTALRSDIGELRVAGFMDYNTGEMWCKSINDFDGDELALIEWTREKYLEADVLVGFNSQAFDKNFLRGVSARHGIVDLPKRFHIDLYQVCRHGFKGLPQSYSLENMADFFGLVEQKDHPSKHDWRGAIARREPALERIKQRCISDVRVQAMLFDVLKPYWFAWRGQ